MTAPQRWVLVTGAASGIGEATARAFAAQGDRLVLVDRDEARLHEVAESLRGAGTEVEAHCVDVSDRAAVEGLADALHQRIEALDVLVNNAGVLAVGGYEETSYDDFDRVFAVNVRGVVHGMKAFAPAMRRRRRGAIVNVASIAGLVGFSPLTAYSTSKFAVVGLSAAVGGELASSGVTVSCVCPSFVKSRLAETSGLEPAQRRDAERVMNQLGIDADRVAKAIVRAARRGTPLVRVGAQAHALAYLQRLSPSGVSRWLSRLAERSAR